jgi:molybdate transport system substrate-binding protein
MDARSASAQPWSIPALARALLSLAAVIGLIHGAPAAATDLQVAVATNFRVTLEALLTSFAEASGYRGLVSSGSTGQIYAQIRSGAPYDVFLAADAERPRRLEAEGLAVPGTRFTYAIGRLVLWSPSADLSGQGARVLEQARFRHLALANPDTAPYGAAARQVLTRLGLWGKLQGRLVRGQDIGQTYQFVAGGNAELGFIALSQLYLAGHSPQHTYWLVAQNLYDPLLQQAVLLKHGRDNAAARAFLEFLKSETALATIEGYGYGAPERESDSRL